MRQKIRNIFLHPLADAQSLLMLTDDGPQNFQSSRPHAISGSQLSMSVETSTRTLLLYQRNVLFQHSSTSPRLLSPAPVSRRKLAEWICLFEGCFALRCIQRLSPSAWLPGDTLSDNP